ncbi:uncharacterized protein LOC131433164 [Malaya genurostris]|uniref:uncharacterized protein LOC131433164 n=1 Tax=Malaya genurostris TaxID=325434 RepID=UPI0026F3E6A9|nr:uncharacterized protein LOC131433164 [Malaya genurostris]
MDSLSQSVNLEDETGSLRLSRHPSNRSYLTIQNVPRRQRSYMQLENNLRNLFDSVPPVKPRAASSSQPLAGEFRDRSSSIPSPASPPPPPPQPVISEGVFTFGSNRNRNDSTRSRHSS